MHRRIVFALVALVGLIGCEKPCKTGYQRYGVKCVRSPAKDAGIEASNGSDAGSSSMKTDAGRQTAEPSLDAGLMDASDATATDPAPLCYLDKDGDGVGAGEPRPCSDAGDAGVGTLVITTGDCDDEDGQRSPSLSDICGDNVDNDCDGKVDDESNNACGGACTAQLGNQPGEVCSNGLLGACARAGEYVCNGATAVVCNAPSASPSAELCSDSVDNDCDGYINEADAVDGLAWYADCDADGYAASGASSQKSCTKPAVDAVCKGWTRIQPTGVTDSDCKPLDPAYHPGAAFGLPPEGSKDTDLNCDTISEKDTARIGVLTIVGSVGIERVCSGASECNCSRWPGTAPPCSQASSNGYSFYFRRADSEGKCSEMASTSDSGLQFCR